MGFSQERLAEEARVPRKTIYNAETYGNVGARTVEKLATVFGVPVETMLDRDQATAEAVFLASQVSRLAEDAREAFFRALDNVAGRHKLSVQPQARPSVDIASDQLAPPHSESSRASIERAAEAEQFAAEQVPALLRLPRSEWYRRIEEEPRYQSVASCWTMIKEADRMSEERPRVALEYYLLAISVAERPGSASSCHELRVAAWKNYAWTLRKLGEYPQAQVALDTAEAFAKLCADDGKLLARVKLSRAILFTTMQCFDQAVLLVRETQATFTQLNDAAGYEMAIEQEAVILLDRNEGSAASVLLERLATEGVDDETKARRFYNLAKAYTLTGQLSAAKMHLERARVVHEKLGWTHLLHKDAWALGSIKAKVGDVDGALESFERASDGFRELEDADSAIRVDLDRCEIEIESGRQNGKTFDRLRAAASYAIEKRLPQSECRALLFLQRLGRATEATHIRYVKDFIEDLERHPHREFVPPELAA